MTGVGMGEVMKVREFVGKIYSDAKIRVEAVYKINGRKVRIEVELDMIKDEEPEVKISENKFTYSEFNTVVKLVRQAVRKAKRIKKKCESE